MRTGQPWANKVSSSTVIFASLSLSSIRYECVVHDTQAKIVHLVHSPSCTRLSDEVRDSNEAHNI